MILNVVDYEHPVLRAKGRKITKIDDSIRQLAVDMVDTMRANKLIGMAPQQIGNPLQMFVLEVLPDKNYPSQMWMKGQLVSFEHLMPLVIINPEIKTEGAIKSQNEGNPCFPGVYEKVERPERIFLHAHNLENEVIEFSADGLLARAVQHEFDHLQGILFIDRMDLKTREKWDCILT